MKCIKIQDNNNIQQKDAKKLKKKNWKKIQTF